MRRKRSLSLNLVFLMLFRNLENEMGIEILFVIPKGITWLNDWMEFLSYARQVVSRPSFWRCYKKSVSPPNSCVSLPALCLYWSMPLSLCSREWYGETWALPSWNSYLGRLLDDVKNFRSEVGVLFLPSYNRSVLTKMLDDNLYWLIISLPPNRISLSAARPISGKRKEWVKLELGELYPYLSYDPRNSQLFYFFLKFSRIPQKSISQRPCYPL